jgi:hypothetical protein
MSISREDHKLIADIVADAVTAGVEKLRADVYARMLELRTPRFAITPKGELFIGGELAGDVRPVFQSVVVEALKAAGYIKDDDGGDDDHGG